MNQSNIGYVCGCGTFVFWGNFHACYWNSYNQPVYPSNPDRLTRIENKLDEILQKLK